jgi:hypothetical protein
MTCPRSSFQSTRPASGQDSQRRAMASLAPEVSVAPASVEAPWNAPVAGTNYMAAASGVGVVFGRGGGRSSRGGGAPGGRGVSSPMGRGGGGPQPVRDATGPDCNCGEPSVSRTVVKEGENKGRVFYTCPKPRGEQCKYFCWADEASSSTSSRAPAHQPFGGRGPAGASAGAWRGGSTAAARGGGGRGDWNNNVMICSRCKQSGHFARTCPSRERG